jgi:hypothetical protein
VIKELKETVEANPQKCFLHFCWSLRGIDFRDKNKQTGGADRLERRQNQDP